MASLGMLGAQCCLLPVYFDVRQESLYVIVLSHVRLFTTLWTIGHQAALSMRFPRQEYRSGLPFPPPGDFPNPGIEPMSLMSHASASKPFTTSTTWEALKIFRPSSNLWQVLLNSSQPLIWRESQDKSEKQGEIWKQSTWKSLAVSWGPLRGRLTLTHVFLMTYLMSLFLILPVEIR